MVQGGLLLPLAATESAGYRVTERLREVAHARIIQPLPRQQAQALLAACVETARRFNRSANRNKYEIEAIAVYGSYMSQDVELPDLAIGITGRRRAPGERRVVGRATDQTEGTAEIRALFEAQSNYVEVAFFKRLPDVPRPFSVIFKADD
jgi:hypothetical protein